MSRWSIARLGTLALVPLFAVACADDTLSPTDTSSEALSASDAAAAHAHAGPPDAEIGTTAGWFQGETVTFFYNRDFDCPLPVADGGMVGSDSGCALGSAAAMPPRGGNDPVVYVTVPLFEDTDGIALHCPVAGDCINHPSTMDLSRVFGAGTENAALPPHSHVVDVQRGGWWEIEVNGIATREAWDAIEREKSLDEIRVQQALGTVTPDLETNLFLFFSVRPENRRGSGAGGR
jgi:hypothetical protein